MTGGVGGGGTGAGAGGAKYAGASNPTGGGGYDVSTTGCVGVLDALTGGGFDAAGGYNMTSGQRGDGVMAPLASKLCVGTPPYP